MLSQNSQGSWNTLLKKQIMQNFLEKLTIQDSDMLQQANKQACEN